MKKLLNYIGGKLLPPAGGVFLENHEPATGRAYSLVPDSDSRDVEAAVEAAAQQFPSWSGAPAQYRSDLLLKIAGKTEERLEDLAAAESKDTGKPVRLAAETDIPRAVSNFRFFATAALHFFSEFHSTDGKALNYTLRQPLGVAGCISPWNLPLYLFTWKIAPALAAGNCVVAKPSEATPFTAFMLAQICMEAGLPGGVLNIVQGTGAKAGAAIVGHPGIPVISFTGGTRTGAEISRTAAPHFKKLSLELGGKNPNIIFADCDFQTALNTSLRAAFSNQGEICLCGSRILVEKSIYKKFRDAFTEKAMALKTGDPSEGDTDLGALISEQHLKKVLSYIALTKAEGGKVLCGGRRVRLSGRCRGGWFMEPAVIEGLPWNCRTNQEEIFGPVATLLPFENEEEAVRMANATPYGLAAMLWTQDLTRAHRVAGRLQCGIVWINCWMLRDLRTPFGGMKHSGVGREGGFEALRFFTEAKNVCVKL